MNRQEWGWNNYQPPKRISNPDKYGNVLMRDHMGKEWVEHKGKQEEVFYTIEERVAAGVALLDHLSNNGSRWVTIFGRNMNVWWEYIDLDKLDMNSTSLDVLGQLFGYISPRIMPCNNSNSILSYTNFYEPKLSNLEYEQKLYKNGFIPSTENREGPALTEMWTCVILDRLFPPEKIIKGPDEDGFYIVEDSKGRQRVRI